MVGEGSHRFVTASSRAFRSRICAKSALEDTAPLLAPPRPLNPETAPDPKCEGREEATGDAPALDESAFTF